MKFSDAEWLQFFACLDGLSQCEWELLLTETAGSKTDIPGQCEIKNAF